MIVRVLLVFGLIVSPALAADLPDLSLTPGIARTDMTPARACKTKWGSDQRHITRATKAKIFREYGYIGNNDHNCDNPRSRTRRCEIDHLISREILGDDDLKNLWVQAYAGPWNTGDKDRLENAMNKEA